MPGGKARNDSAWNGGWRWTTLEEWQANDKLPKRWISHRELSSRKALAYVAMLHVAICVRRF